MDLHDFHCLRCGNCCKWEGPVRVSAEEIRLIAAFTGVPEDDFIRNHTVLAPDRRSLSLMEKEDGSCVYYDDLHHACLIEDVKPAQCRAFPKKWNFPGWEELCAGGKALKKAERAVIGP